MASSDRTVANGHVSWQNQETNHNGEIVTTQMNVKDIETGDHKFYDRLTGEQGVAFGKERLRDWK